jgi:prevent-host-death family protein
MRTISQREFRNRSAAVMDAVEAGETVRVTRNGVEVAELRPVRAEPFTPVAALKRALAGLPTGGYLGMRAEADDFFRNDDRVER